MHKQTDANTETIDYNVLAERVRNLTKQLESDEGDFSDLADRVRLIELYNSSQKDVPDKIQHNEDLIKQMGDSRDAEIKDKHDYFKEFVLIVVSALMSYILSKMN